MPDDKKGANELDSLNSRPGEKSPPDEGKNPPKTPEQLLSEHKAENQRKQEEISKLKAEKSALDDELQELRQKQDEEGLTRKERERKEDIEGDIEDIKAAAKKLRAQKETQPWIQVAREEMADTMVDYEIGKANEFVEDTAAELKIEPKELAKELIPFAAKYQHMRPERRNQLAYRDLKAAKSKQASIEAQEAKLKELEDKERTFREGPGRSPRKTTPNDKFETADKSDRLKMAVDLIG
jgi:hypothetical protein